MSFARKNLTRKAKRPLNASNSRTRGLSDNKCRNPGAEAMKDVPVSVLWTGIPVSKTERERWVYLRLYYMTFLSQAWFSQSEGHCLVLPHVPSAGTFLISQNPSLFLLRCERFTCPQLQSWTIPFNTWNDKNTSSVLFPGHRTSFLSWLFTKNTILPILERYQVTIVTCYSLDYTFRGYVLKTSFCLTIVLTVGVTVEYSRTYLSKQAKSYRRT